MCVCSGRVDGRFVDPGAESPRAVPASRKRIKLCSAFFLLESELNLIATMRPAIAAPSEGVSGSGVQALTAARMLATIIFRKPSSAART